MCGFAGKVSDPRFKVGRSRFQGQEGQVSRSGGSGCRSGGSGSGFEVGRVKVLVKVWGQGQGRKIWGCGSHVPPPAAAAFSQQQTAEPQANETSNYPKENVPQKMLHSLRFFYIINM